MSPIWLVATLVSTGQDAWNFPWRQSRRLRGGAGSFEPDKSVSKPWLPFGKWPVFSHVICRYYLPCYSFVRNKWDIIQIRYFLSSTFQAGMPFLLGIWILEDPKVLPWYSYSFLMTLVGYATKSFFQESKHPGEGNSKPLQYPCLVGFHGVTKSWTWLSVHTHTHTHTHTQRKKKIQTKCLPVFKGPCQVSRSPTEEKLQGMRKGKRISAANSTFGYAEGQHPSPCV